MILDLKGLEHSHKTLKVTTLKIETKTEEQKFLGF